MHAYAYAMLSVQTFLKRSHERDFQMELFLNEPLTRFLNDFLIFLNSRR
jgi:hypothetical protein